MRTYLSGLPGATAVRVEAVLQEVRREAEAPLELEEDPAVWLFAQGRRRLGSGGQRGDVMVADAADDEAVAGEDPRIAVHRGFERLTPKQQEVVRLKFQFSFSIEELARITNVSPGGAAGLLHSAVARICQVTGVSLLAGADVRLTAYALDELGPAEKQAFAEGVPDGRALLESSDTIRKTGTLLAGVLESGAPLPKRSRRRKGGAGWKSPGGLLVGTAVIVTVALVWYFRRDSGETTATRGEMASGMNGSFATPTRSRRAETGGVGRAGDRPDTTEALARNSRTLRPGEADWEKKSFGWGHKHAPDAEGSGVVSNPSQAGGETAPSGEQGGTRSPGAPSGPAENAAPRAENRGEAGTSDTAENQGSGPDGVADETTAPSDSASVTGDSAASTATMKASGKEMKPAKPEVAQANSEPGSGTEAGKTQPAPTPSPGVADLQRTLAKRRWPKSGQVRVAEMVQQTPSAETTPDNATDEALAAEVEVARSPWKPDKLLVRVTLKARPMPVPARPPANLVFAIDVSQSMAGPNRLPLVQEGIRLLAQRLRPEDRVAVVTYAAGAKEMLPGIPLGGKALELRNCLGALEAAGQTNGYEGLQRAYEAARRGRVGSGLNVVVLCTDGNFNLGETDETVLAGMAAQAAAEGIKLSVFGFGRSDRNDLRLELLAAKGGGRSCYVNTREEAERLLATQIDGLLEAAAQEVALTVKFNPERVAQADRIDGGNEATHSAAVAELLPGRSLGAMYEVSLKADGEGAGGLAELGVSYRLPGLPAMQRRSIRLEGIAQDWVRTDPGFRFAAAWAEFGRILQGERSRASGELDRLEAWVQRDLPDDAGGYRSELLENVAAARVAASAL